ncbi:hypothetical protein KJ562_00305 [Patescibacteria group bacterium]|nr:hypothetical protein [Patescibacteria group bacterium]MBU4162078.1 hypothetical protein [Patescibacteria group bacterium]
MKKLWQLRENAIKLRRLGWAYSEIQKKVPVHKITLSKWCRDIELTSRQIKSHGGRYANRLKGAKANCLKRQKEIIRIQKKAENEIHILTPYELKIAGAALYWGEGNKSHGLAFSNSDPELVKFMMKWFQETCEVPNKKIRAYLYLHTGQNEKKMQKYWSRVTNIPLNQFNKTILKKEGSASRKYSQDKYKGTIKIQVLNENLKHRILSWIEQFNFT